MRTWLLLGCLCCLAGCGTEPTETGYIPRPLNRNESIRRGYYAAPYSPEEREAAAAKEKQSHEFIGVDYKPEGSPR